MASKNALKTAICTRPAHRTGIKSWILWVEVPYAPSATTGEASQTGLDRGHNGGMELRLTTRLPLFGNSHFFSYPLYFHYLHISYLIPFYSLFIPLSFPASHFTLLCCPSTGLIFLFPLHLLPYFLPTNPQLVLLFWILHFISLHASALLATPQAYLHVHTGSHFVPATPPSRTCPNISAMLT